MEPETVGMSLEESEVVTPPVAPAVESPPPAPVLAAPQAVEEPEPEGTIEIPQGKVVPLGAVQAERAKRKEAERLASEKDAKIAELSQKAQAYDEAKGYLDQARPIIEEIRQKKNQPTQPAPEADQRLINYAKEFDLFDAAGKPDVARAKRILDFHTSEAQRIAQQAVAPILQTEAQRQAAQMYHHYVNQPEVNGFKIDANTLAKVWNTVPPEIAVQPGVAEVLYNTALGLQLRSGHKPTQAPPPPLVSESVGAGKPTETTLTSLDERFLQASGMKPSDFKETRERYKPGQNNSLE
jgi:hypothetical protein